MNVNPLTHLKGEIDKVKAIIKQISEAKEVSQLPANVEDYQADTT